MSFNVQILSNTTMVLGESWLDKFNLEFLDFTLILLCCMFAVYQTQTCRAITFKTKHRFQNSWSVRSASECNPTPMTTSHKWWYDTANTNSILLQQRQQAPINWEEHHTNGNKLDKNTTQQTLVQTTNPWIFRLLWLYWYWQSCPILKVWSSTVWVVV